MGRRAGWWPGRLAGSDRLVVYAATVARGSAIVLTGCFVALAWPHVRSPGWSLLIAGILVVESTAVIGWWLRTGSPSTVTPLLDVAVCAAATIAAAEFAAHPRLGMWAGFVVPYTVVVAFTVGLACRHLLTAALYGLLLVAAGAGSSAVLLHQPLLSAVAALPILVVNPLVGAASGRLLHRAAVDLDVAHADAVRELRAVTAEQERVRYAMALHDRVLQTLEILSQTELVNDPELHQRVAEQAFWLRCYVEGGGEPERDDLAGRLAVMAWSVWRSTGTRVEVNDAGLRGAGAPSLDGADRERLVTVARHLLTCMASECDAVVLRITRSRTGTTLSMRGSGDDVHLDQAALDLAGRRMAEIGGMMLVEAIPYIELHFPDNQPAVSDDLAPRRAASP